MNRSKEWGSGHQIILSVVVDDLNVLWPGCGPFEEDPPLLVNPNAVVASSVTLHAHRVQQPTLSPGLQRGVGPCQSSRENRSRTIVIRSCNSWSVMRPCSSSIRVTMTSWTSSPGRRVSTVSLSSSSW